MLMWWQLKRTDTTMRVVLRGLIAVLALSFASRLQAQQYFGQNQVQYKHFKWRVLETEHFLVHYYPEERAAVVDAARMAERSYARLSRVLGHQFKEKKPIILFASRAAARAPTSKEWSDSIHRSGSWKEWLSICRLVRITR